MSETPKQNRTRQQKKLLVRSNQLLSRKFSQYLVPTMITYAALSLNEFVDSMLVSNLLGSDALAIVGLGAPIMLAMAAIYALLGNGGSTVYAIAIGRRDHRTAGQSMTAAVVISLASGIILLLAGIFASGPLARMLCHEARLLEPFEEYMRVLLYSAPLVIVILTVVSFLPAAGYPGFSTAVNVIANVVNIIMDYVYIRVFHMSVTGAAWATITGYAVAGAVVIAAFAGRKIKLYFSRQIGQSLSQLMEIYKLGRPDAMNQIGLSIQFAVCNRLATAAAGRDGVVALSLCLQSSSVMSVLIGAVIGSGVPIMAVLHGQRDYTGEAGILKTSMISQMAASVIGIFVFVIFAPQAAALYNIKLPAQVALSVAALRIYSLMYLPRNAVITYYRYLKVIGLSRYSTVLSALDSFAAIVPIAWIMTKLFGIMGLYWAFPLASLILLVITVICNRRYEVRSDGRLQGPLLIEHDEDAKPVIDATITKDPADISGVSEQVQLACEENGISPRNAMRAALAVEEIAVYVANKKMSSTYADVLVRLAGGHVEIDFRSLGEAFDPQDDTESDIQENVRLLRGVASSIENEYLLGMNSTRIVIEGPKADVQ